MSEFFAIFGSNMGSLRVGRCLKSFLEVLRFVVTEYRAMGSHGDLIRDQNCGLGNIWETSGGIWGASRGIREASERLPWRLLGLRDPRRVRARRGHKKLNMSQLKCKSSFNFFKK